MSTSRLQSDFGAGDAGASTAAGPDSPHFLLWDLPLRVFHWLLVAAVAAAVLTGELGGSWMTWHGRAGLLILGLLVFRFAWGIVGSATSRFSQFAPSPAALRACLRGRWRGVGHNPLGALAVFALLALLSLQVGTGLFGNDDITFAGPLNHLVGDQSGSRATGWHRLLANGLFVLLALHLLAIAFHVVVKRHRLIRPMITGKQRIEPGVPLPRRVHAGRHWLAAAVVLAATVVAAISGAGRVPGPDASLAEPAAAGPAAQPIAASASAAAPAW